MDETERECREKNEDAGGGVVSGTRWAWTTAWCDPVALGIRFPTHAQIRSIPLTLKGLDVSCRAHTGSGKTLAYLLPSLHKVFLADKKKNASEEGASPVQEWSFWCPRRARGASEKSVRGAETL